MTDDNKKPPLSFKPPERGLEYYKKLPREATAQKLREILVGINLQDTLPCAAPPPPTAPAPSTSSDEQPETSRRRRLFSLNLNVDIEEGDNMTEPELFLAMAFKSHIADLKLTPDQTQLILHGSELRLTGIPQRGEE